MLLCNRNELLQYFFKFMSGYVRKKIKAVSKRAADFTVINKQGFQNEDPPGVKFNKSVK